MNSQNSTFIQEKLSSNQGNSSSINGDEETLSVEQCKAWIDPQADCTTEQRQSAIELLQFAAKFNNSNIAKAFLGVLMLKGWYGIPKDEIQAYEYIKGAADNGLMYAKEQLLTFYVDRQSFKQAYALADEMLKLDPNHASANYFMGLVFEEGMEGVPVDPFASTMHFKKSNTLGGVDRYVSHLMTGFGCTQDLDLAESLSKQHYENTNSPQLAYLVSQVLRQKEDPAEAQWLQKAAEAGWPAAMEELQKRGQIAKKNAELKEGNAMLREANARIFIGEVTSVSTWSDTEVSGNSQGTYSKITQHHKVFFKDQTGNTREFDLGKYSVHFEKGNHIYLVNASVPDGVFDGFIFIKNLSTGRIYSEEISTDVSINWWRSIKLGALLWAGMAVLSYITPLMHNNVTGLAIPAIAFGYWILDLIKDRIKRGIARPPIIENWRNLLRDGSKNILDGHMLVSRENNPIKLELVKINS